MPQKVTSSIAALIYELIFSPRTIHVTTTRIFLCVLSTVAQNIKI